MSAAGDPRTPDRDTTTGRFVLGDGVGRFLARTVIKDGCWSWVGNIAKDGYGLLWFEGRTQRAHRIAWKIYKGAIPDGLWVLHTCDNRKRVNPNHLFLGSAFDNMQDCAAKGRLWLQHSCKRGHPWTEEHTHIRPNGHRVCKTCQRARKRGGGVTHG